MRAGKDAGDYTLGPAGRSLPPPRDRSPPTVSGDHVPASTLYKSGDLLEGYRVMSEIGQGAASTIYLVQDPKTKQIWSLKHVVKNSDKDVRFLEQAEAEYAIASKLDHPNLRKIDRLIKKKAGFLSAANELFLVMEYVDGRSVDRHPPRTFVEAARVFEQVAEGMAYMHARGFVHADMKPNNIIVDDHFTAKIIDLGQSCAVGQVKKRIQGTADYIAPEQVHLRPITEKTDVYNLGASMYWALTKHFVPTALPKGDSLVSRLDDDLIERPKPPSAINPRVPALFDALIMECVEIEPAKRPTMKEVAGRLNLIRAKIEAESELRKSGSFDNVSPGKSGSPIRPAGSDDSNGSRGPRIPRRDNGGHAPE